MHRIKSENILKLSASDRYKYFLRKVCDYEVVWGLYSDGWAIGQLNSTQVIPVWPEKSFAEACAIDQWFGFQPKPIPLEAFVKKWIPGATADSRKFAIFPTITDAAIAVENELLLEDIRIENSQYL